MAERHLVIKKWIHFGLFETTELPKMCYEDSDDEGTSYLQALGGAMQIITNHPDRPYLVVIDEAEPNEEPMWPFHNEWLHVLRSDKKETTSEPVGVLIQ